MKSKRFSRAVRIKRKGSRGSQLGDNLDVFDLDRTVLTEPSENRIRRSIVIKRLPGEPCGFTLQSYGLYKKQLEGTELLTYVDYVEIGGAAYHAGLRRGDVILSIDGVSTEFFDHYSLISFIKNSPNAALRMVVLFDDCCRRIELQMRSLKLEHLLSEKLRELQVLERHERKLLGLDVGSTQVRSDNRALATDQLSTYHSTYAMTSVHEPGTSSQRPHHNTGNVILHPVPVIKTTLTTGGTSIPPAFNHSHMEASRKEVSFDSHVHRESLLWTLNPVPSEPTPPNLSARVSFTHKNNWFRQRASHSTSGGYVIDKIMGQIRTPVRRESDCGSLARRRGGRHTSISRRRCGSVSYVRRAGSTSAVDSTDRRSVPLRLAGPKFTKLCEYIALEDEETKL